MRKMEKKRKKLQDRIDFLEEQIYINLKQKTSNTAEISISEYQRKIADLRKQLEMLS